MTLLFTYTFFLLGVLFIAWLPALVVSLGGYVYSLYARRNDIADVLWPVGIAASALVLFLLVNYSNIVLKLALVLIIVWATRLSFHIGSRFFEKDEEDQRYARWRNSWKWFKTRSFFQVFMLQSLLMIVILSPFIMYVFSPGDIPTWQLVLGVWLWCVGFFFESVGDWQLGQFLKDPSRYGLARGDLMTKGLWGRTRHPNYFGEICMWWGLFIMTIHSLNIWQFIPAVVGPLVITYLLYYVSGVRLTESLWKNKFPEQYKEYQARVPVLFPRIW